LNLFLLERIKRVAAVLNSSTNFVLLKRNPQILRAEVRSHFFELKNWFKRCVNRWFYIEIRNDHWKCKSQTSMSVKNTKLNVKSTAHASFESIFEFEEPDIVIARSDDRNYWAKFLSRIWSFVLLKDSKMLGDWQSMVQKNLMGWQCDCSTLADAKNSGNHR
jgi:hypothetical protein